MMKKVLFIDRDGTIIKEPADEQIDSYEKLEFLPGVIGALAQISRQTDYQLVMVTNQDGLGTASFSEADFWPVHNLMLRILKAEGIEFDEILIDRSFPADKAPTRKPETGLLTHYLKGNYDLSQSFVIGDRKSDVQLAQNLGAKAIFMGSGDDAAVLSSSSWQEIEQFLTGQPRIASYRRKTSETDIDLQLNLDGKGQADIHTGLGFFDHMLEQIARHGNLDLKVQVRGDLEIDEHHTIEDVGLALGSVFAEALGSKKGIERYGFVLPMDESKAEVSLDFGGRPWLIWEADFQREMIGQVPTEMFEHFFKSFSDTAACNLHIKARGKNEHHKIEGIFKAFARAIKRAKNKTAEGEIPSTKGSL